MSDSHWGLAIFFMLHCPALGRFVASCSCMGFKATIHKATQLLVLTGICMAMAKCPAQAQVRVWGALSLEIPEGYASNKRSGTIVYSNSNQKGAEPLSITLYDAIPYEGRMDTLFAHAWRSRLGTLASTEEEAIPRWRRFYTNDGVLMQQGFAESQQNGQPIYRLLTLYVGEGFYQPVLITTTSLKAYKPIQAAWQERLQNAVLRKPK